MSGRVFACSDLHGMLNLYDAIKNFLQPEDIVYFLGDAGDRGLQPWETIKAIAADPQFIYLKGNHEDMLVNASLFKLKLAGFTSNPVNLLHINGGDKTLQGLLSEKNPIEWIKKLNALPSYFMYKNKQGKKIHLSHAGFSPWSDWNDPTQIEIPKEFQLLWDRNHLTDEWEPDYMIDNNELIVHGHTWITYIKQMLGITEVDKEKVYEPEAFWYMNNHKICIDYGSYITQKSLLLDLDTFEEKIIIMEGK